MLAATVACGNGFADPVDQTGIQLFHHRLFHGGMCQTHLGDVEIERAPVHFYDDFVLLPFGPGYNPAAAIISSGI